MPRQHVNTHIALITGVCLCLLAFLFWTGPEQDQLPPQGQGQQPTLGQGQAPYPEQGQTASTAAPDYDSPQSISVVVNKARPLTDPAYLPEDLADAGGVTLRAEAASAYQRMSADAAAEGVGMSAVSGFRPADAQALLHASYIDNYGASAAESISARAGYSEHQTGLAVDIGNPDGACSLQACFDTTPAGAWAAAHASKYGFIVRYPDGAAGITGFDYEPWHLRYVGVDLAGKLAGAGITLEEYAGLPAAPGY
ncbi:M15 family metallopeptidase [Arthrobacter sp.]|uniref:M15 family metallopeptidase n=1 Tax=Arthrobacter sp. TaxID=1667 RepID=UPI00289E3104|nr:M15 family metallopeptidase [Arthrobacter sp.]